MARLICSAWFVRGGEFPHKSIRALLTCKYVENKFVEICIYFSEERKEDQFVWKTFIDKLWSMKGLTVSFFAPLLAAHLVLVLKYFM